MYNYEQLGVSVYTIHWWGSWWLAIRRGAVVTNNDYTAGIFCTLLMYNKNFGQYRYTIFLYRSYVSGTQTKGYDGKKGFLNIPIHKADRVLTYIYTISKMT